MIVLCVINEMNNSEHNQKARQETGRPREVTSVCQAVKPVSSYPLPG
jgi:hypothetical protein